jgi:pimeloyl-ACP methyl ester carboxylesterase
MYDEAVGQLQGVHKLVAISPPGFGGGSIAGQEITAEACADAAAEILNALAIDSVVFAGTSWGGQVGAHFAVRHADRCDGLLLANTPVARTAGTSSAGALVMYAASRVILRTNFWAKGVARSMLPLGFRSSRPERISAFTADFRTFNPRDAAVVVRSVMLEFSGLEVQLSQIAVPTIVVLGAEDRLYPADELMPSAEGIRGAEIWVVPASGHLTALEQPEIFSDAVRKLARNRRSRPCRS